jgi:hypothetical protein
MTSENGFNEYKRMMLAEIEANQKFREETRGMFKEVNNQFREVHTQLTEIHMERRLGKWVLGVLVPAIVAVAVTVVFKKFGL